MIKKVFLVLLIGIFILSAFTACSNNDKYAEKIIGKWECKYGNDTLVLIFEEGGTGTARLSPSPTINDVKIEYTLNGEDISITSYRVDSQGEAIGTGEYSVRYYNGNLLFKPRGSAVKPNTFYKVGD